MVPRDFAQKPKTPQRQQPQRLPRWVRWLAFGSAALLLTSLVVLSQLPDDLEAISLPQLALPTLRTPDTNPEVEPIQAPAIPASPARTPLEFYTLLRDTGVLVTDDLLALRQRDIAEVEAQTPTHEPTPNYIIQVASFARQGDAETLRAQLILEGLTSAHLVLADLGEQGQFHRVMVGPVQGLGSAQAIAASLEQLGLQGMVRQQPNEP